MKPQIDVFIRRVLRAVSYCFRIFPIKNNRIVFYGSSFEGYKCNPKYLYLYISEKYGDKYEYIWEFWNPKKQIMPKNVRVVKHYSFIWFYYMATSKVIICNSGLGGLTPKRKKQLIIETWHGGGAYKVVGYGQFDANCKSKWVRDKLVNDDLSIYISSSKIFTKYHIIGGYNFKGEIFKCGMPRNDIFFYPERVAEAKRKIQEHYGISGRIILYAPTFRGAAMHYRTSETVIDANRVLESYKKRYGEEATLLVRAHFGTEFSNKFGDNVLNVTDYPDMQELLCAADILINDYSSSMWDYSLLGRPCFFYVPDLDYYENSDRGFFTPIETWPGIICHDMDELCHEIEHLDEARCAEIARKHQEYAGTYENGKACEAVCKRIVEFCNS